MRVLFCHDGPIRKDEVGNYYGLAHNDDMFKRYLSIANQISVVIRVSDITKVDAERKYSRITIKPLQINPIPNILSFKGIIRNRKKAKNIIEKAVVDSDYIVARLPSTSGFIAINYAKKYNKPYLTEVVACPWDAFWNHSFKGKLVAPYMYLATKRHVKNSKYVVYVTNEFLQRRYSTKGKSVSCSNVALTEFNDGILKRRLDKINELNKESKIIIGTTAAVDVRYKGQQYVIQALGKLKEQGYTNYEYQLVGAGDQTYLESIAKKYGVEDKVKFLGPMPHIKVFDWLETIDIYAQPSRQEGLPRALIEAMSRGIPSFGAKTAGIPELLESDVLFSNTKNNIDEICSILVSYTKEKMQSQAKRNFEESKKYDKEIIEKRRSDFLKRFKDSIRL